MTAAAIHSRCLMGQTPKETAVMKGMDLIAKYPPRWRESQGRVLSTINMYHWFHGTYAVFAACGRRDPRWKAWNTSLQESLLGSQRKKGKDEAGGWDPIGEWGITGGRVYSTALNALTLEVYYRGERND